MKKIIQLLYILFAVAAFSACSDDNQGEVVSQDLSYQLDANYVFVDIPESFCLILPTFYIWKVRP